MADFFKKGGFDLDRHGISGIIRGPIYSRLKNPNLLGKYSVQDFIMHLKYIQRIKINSSWITGEISGKTKKLLEALDIHIT